jgi:protocatechuate 4,5-dioxygenase, beta chain
MATLVMAAATPHNPLLWRTMVDPVPDDLRGVADNFALIAQAIDDLDVDVIVEIGTDHIRQFHSDNCPAFAIGMAESYHGTFENEVRTFGMPYCEITGHRELAEVIAGREVLTDAIDFAVCHEWRLDHGFVLPLMYLTPSLDVPVVPINVNGVLPPLPGAARYAALGRHVGDSIAAWDSSARVALLTSGHMATEIGGARQFLGGGSSDPQFDEMAVRWMREGDLDAAVAGCSYDRVTGAGNMTYQYVNVLAALAAMGGRPAELAEATPSRYAPSPFFLWRAP